MEKNNLLITAQQLINMRFHLGHKKNRIHNSIIPFLEGYRNNIAILSIRIIIYSFYIIIKGLKELFAQKAVFFLASTQRDLPIYEYFKQYQSFVNKQEPSKMFVQGFMVDKWINGVFTNYFFFRKLINQIYSTEYLYLNSRDKNYFYYLEGVKKRHYFPVPEIVLLFGYNFDICKEFNILNIPIIGIYDTNGNNQKYTYGIPANDDSFETLQFFFELIVDCQTNAVRLEHKRFEQFCMIKLKAAIKRYKNALKKNVDI